MNIPLFLVAVNGFFVVAVGAFGAHALEQILSPGSMDTFNTAIQYQMFHVIGLMVIGLQPNWRIRGNRLRSTIWLFQGGIVLFSGSLYLLAVSGITWLGMITPLGGLAFLAAWSQLAWTLFKQDNAG